MRIADLQWLRVWWGAWDDIARRNGDVRGRAGVRKGKAGATVPTHNPTAPNHSRYPASDALRRRRRACGIASFAFCMCPTLIR